MLALFCLYGSLIAQATLAGLKLNRNVGHSSVAMAMTLLTFVSLLAVYYFTYDEFRERTNWWLTILYISPFFMVLGDVVANSFWDSTRKSAVYRMTYSILTAIFIGVVYFSSLSEREERDERGG